MSIPRSATTGEPVNERLIELGLTAPLLRGAVLDSHTEAAACTIHDTLGMAGSLAWGKAIASARDRLTPEGWIVDRENQLEGVRHPDGSHRIVVSSGNSNTGSERMPKTKNPKGAATGQAVKGNAAQLSLAQESSAFSAIRPAERAVVDRCATWFLLYYFDKDRKEIRVELSLPAEMEGKQITKWRERLVLDAIPFEAHLEIVPDDEEDDDIDIDVRRAE